MRTVTYLLGLAGGLLVLALVVELLRRRHLRGKYALLYLGLSLIAAVFAVVPPALTGLARLLGVAVPANLLFFGAAIVLLLASMQLAYECGRLEEETRTLAEEIGLLRQQVEALGRPQVESSSPVVAAGGSILTRGRATSRLRALQARRGVVWLLVAAALLLVSVVVVVPAATGPGGVSPVDELWYADALDKASHGQLSRTGDKIDEYARQVKACRGVIGLYGPSPTCGGPQPDASEPIGGYTSADVHAPTYFFLTAGLARTLRAAGVTNDILIAGRLVGVLWLTLGLLLLVATGRAFGAGFTNCLLTAVAVGCSPLLVSVSGYVTPDALGLAVGSLVVLAVVRWRSGRLPWWSLGLVSLATAFVKVPFVLAPLFCAVLLVLEGLTGPTGQRRPLRAVLPAAAALVGGAGAGAVAWQLTRRLLAVGTPVLHPDAAPPVALQSFAKYFGYYLDSIPATSGAPLPVPALLGLAVRPLMWLLIATALGGLVLLPKDRLTAVRWAGTLGMLFGSMVLSAIVLVASGGFLIGTPRYGLALLPLWAVPLMAARSRLVVLGLALAAAGSLVAQLSLW